MRPMFLEYPKFGDPAQDNAVWSGTTPNSCSDATSLSPRRSWMANPLEVLLPHGDWYDYWTGKRLTGTHQLKRNVALDELPLYVRAGAIIPEQPLTQSTTEVPQGPLELRVYPGPDCKGSLYWDQGDGFEYQKGGYYRQSFSCETTKSSVTVNLGAVEGSYAPWFKSIKVVVYDARAPKSAMANGGTAKTEAADGSASIEIPASREAAKIELTY